jgi:hypothetical protein
MFWDGILLDYFSFASKNFEEVTILKKTCPEMEFLDVNLIKVASLLFHAILSPFNWWILKKTILFSGFNNPYKKIRETRKLESIDK